MSDNATSDDRFLPVDDDDRLDSVTDLPIGCFIDVELVEEAQVPETLVVDDTPMPMDTEHFYSLQSQASNMTVDAADFSSIEHSYSRREVANAVPAKHSSTRPYLKAKVRSLQRQISRKNKKIKTLSALVKQLRAKAIGNANSLKLLGHNFSEVGKEIFSSEIVNRK